MECLNKEIDYFKAILSQHLYLIMSKDTAEFMFKETFNDGIIVSYDGYEIFIDDDLEFGMVYIL